MSGKFRNVKLDFVTVGLTILAFIFQNIGFFAGPWWKNNGGVGDSSYSMMSFKICVGSCIDKTILDLTKGWEWMLTVRLFEIFGECCVALAFVMAILAVTVRLRVIHTGVIYIHATAAVFILLGVFIFLGFHTTLDKYLEEETACSSQYPCYLCLIAALFCISSSIVSGFALKKHLLEWNDDDEVNIVM